MSLFTPLGRSVRMRVIPTLLLVLALAFAAAPASAAGIFGGNDDAQQASRDTAALTLRVQNLEQQVRDLTGQVQGLQFQMTQLQTLIDRMNQDNDFRFKALEGGKGGGSGKSSSLSPSDDAPAAATSRPTTQVASAAPGGGGVAIGSGKAAGDGLGGSLDPLVGKGKPGAGDADVVPLGPSSGQAVASNPAGNDDSAPASAPAAPLKLASTGGAVSANPAAASEYKTGYDAIVKGNYPEAADKFKDFIKQYPDDPQAADATNWLGEALLQQQDYVDAADVLVTGYKTYPTSARAPDMLLKLGIALAGAEQQDAACKTFGLLSTKYPNTTTAFRTRLKQEMARGKCPA